MSILHNVPTIQFCIEVRLSGTNDIVDRFTIEQTEAGKRDKRREDRIYTTVQRHLNRLSERNGLDYAIVRWGDIKDRSGWIAGKGFDD